MVLGVTAPSIKSRVENYEGSKRSEVPLDFKDRCCTKPTLRVIPTLKEGRLGRRQGICIDRLAGQRHADCRQSKPHLTGGEQKPSGVSTQDTQEHVKSSERFEPQEDRPLRPCRQGTCPTCLLHPSCWAHPSWQRSKTLKTPGDLSDLSIPGDEFLSSTDQGKISSNTPQVELQIHHSHAQREPCRSTTLRPMKVRAERWGIGHRP